MQRLKDQRGATAVMVALLMVPLIGFAAISIDVAAIYAERQQLQAGADAAAVAIAQDCGRGVCGTPAQTATDFAKSNLNSHDTSTATVTSLTTSSVTVKNVGVRQHWFAPVLGISSTSITTTSSVSWGAPTAGTALLPLAFSWCEWKAQTDNGAFSSTTPYTIHLSKTSGTTGCTGPSNNVVPGGFGWLTVNSGSCNVKTTITDVLNSDPGNSMPSTCSTADLAAVRGTRVLLPVFDQSAGTGSGATYRVYGYAAFVMTGYYFGSQNSWNSPCGGNDRCISGYFVRFVDSSQAFTIGAGAPQLGGSIITFTS